MEPIDEVRSKLRMKRQEYQTLRDDYELLRQNIVANVDAKKAMRIEITELTKKFQELKAQANHPYKCTKCGSEYNTVEGRDGCTCEEINSGSDSLL